MPSFDFTPIESQHFSPRNAYLDPPLMPTRLQELCISFSTTLAQAFYFVVTSSAFPPKPHKPQRHNFAHLTIRVRLLLCWPFYTIFSFELLLPQKYFHDLFSAGGSPIFFTYMYIIIINIHRLLPLCFSSKTQFRTKIQGKEQKQNNKIPT